jgi:rare lipoprotein A
MDWTITLWRLILVGSVCVVATGCASVGREPIDGTGSRTRATPAPPPSTPAPPLTTGPRPTPLPSPTRPAPAPGATSGVDTGKASWYGDVHQGKKTASGETYDMHKLTAAHLTLPFGTRVRVTNVDNGRSVVVRVNDRGPLVAGRIIDLSQAAARALGALGAGVFTVRIEILEDAAAEPPSSPASR